MVLHGKERRLRPRPAPAFIRVAAVGQSSWERFLSDVLGGWIPVWLALPEIGFWHEEQPEPVTKVAEAETRMKYDRAA